MKFVGTVSALLIVTALCLPSACSADPSLGGSRPSLAQDSVAVRSPTAGRGIAPDLRRLARSFVSYAVGDSDTFPHWESVSMSIGGEPVVSIDDLSAALSQRRIWSICPADWKGYAGASCPVDLLAPITNARANGFPLVYSSEYDDMLCAPARTGPLPHGRLVVLRPTPRWRSCAGDFALVLAADERGRVRSIDLTLSEP